MLQPSPPLSPAGQPLATFADRLLAHLIDAAVFLGVALVLIPFAVVLFTRVLPGSFDVQPDGTISQPDPFSFLVPLLLLEAVLMVIMLGLSYVYHVEMMFRSGQTLGKKAMKIRVAPLDPAATLDRTFAAKRFLVQTGSGFVPGLSYLDGLWQLWDKPYQQCLHDKFARTVVVKVPG